MTDTHDGTTIQGAAADASGLPDGADFTIKKIFVKDVSFESPGTPHIFMREWKPDVGMHLHSQAIRFSPSDYEVTLSATVTVKVEEETAFLCEAQMAGVFAIVGLTSEELKLTLGSYAPTILFPYLREVVSDLSVRGGFPQLVLAPVNFDVLFGQQLQRDEEEGDGESETAGAEAAAAGGEPSTGTP